MCEDRMMAKRQAGAFPNVTGLPAHSFQDLLSHEEKEEQAPEQHSPSASSSLVAGSRQTAEGGARRKEAELTESSCAQAAPLPPGCNPGAHSGNAFARQLPGVGSGQHRGNLSV